MSEDTYVKFFRSAIKHRYFSNVKLWHFYQYCILKASRFGHMQMVGFQSVEVGAGDFIFGRSVAAIECGLTEQEIRTCIKRLEQDKKIIVKSTNKFSVISVLNFNTWQSSLSQINQQVTSKQPTSNQQLTTIKKEKKEKNKDICVNHLFEEFWNVCPTRAKRCGKAGALTAWQKHVKGNELEVIESMKKHANCKDWTKDNGQFIPMATTWLNQHRWTAEIQEERESWRVI